MRVKIQLLIIPLLLGLSCSLYALNFDKYANNHKTLQVDEASRRTLLGTFENCGDASLNDDCVIQALTRISQEENNLIAKNIIDNYNKALDEGNMVSMPECQVGSHFQVNQIIAHCILLLNYVALKEQNQESAKVQYEMCLQGGMSGLAYNSNLVAQFLLIQIFEEKQITENANFWKKTVSTKKGSEEYDLLMACYR